jgi:hypothetical protein
MMSKEFLRPLEAADRGKAWEAEQVVGMELPTYRQVVSSPDLALRTDEETPGILLVGYAELGTLDSDPGWKIKKVLTTGSSISILWAEGTSAYQHRWTERNSLIYL